MALQFFKDKDLFYSCTRVGGNVAGALHQNLVLIAEKGEQVAAGDAALRVIYFRLLAGSAGKNKLLVVGGIDQALAGGTPPRLHQQDFSLGDGVVNLAGPGGLRGRGRLRRLEINIELA